MTLNGRYAVYYRKGAHHKRPILSAAKMYANDSSFWGDIRFMRILAEVPWGGGVKRQWGCRQRQFSVFSLAISSETLEMRPALLYSDIRSTSSAFQWSQNAWPWIILFALNSVFAPVWLALTVRLSKNNCEKTNKDRHTLSAVQIFGRDCSFW